LEQTGPNANWRGSLLNRVGALWLVTCAAGPFLGWIVTAFPLTLENWQWQYALRVLLAMILPVAAALPLLRHARGRAALVAAPILVIVTALPAMTGLAPLQDLLAGPEVRRIAIVHSPVDALMCESLDGRPIEFACPGDQINGFPGQPLDILVLPHTQRVLAVSGP
jgi:MFS family permease